MGEVTDPRQHVVEWLLAERANYADQKYADGLPHRDEFVEAMKANGAKDDRWYDFIGNYLKRAQLFGLDTLQGRQALGKAASTIMHYLETAVTIHGAMPQPGISSTNGAPEWKNAS